MKAEGPDKKNAKHEGGVVDGSGCEKYCKWHGF